MAPPVDGYDPFLDGESAYPGPRDRFPADPYNPLRHGSTITPQEDSFLLLEGADFLLLEGTDRLILEEGGTVVSGAAQYRPGLVDYED